MSTQRPYGGRTAVERVADRRHRLVEATIEVVGGGDGARATMTAVCQAAGLTERYFYESFASLDDALLAALDRVCDDIITLTTATVERSTGPVEARVHAVMTAFVDFVQQSPARARVAVTHSSANPRLRARRHELTVVLADVVAREAARLHAGAAWPDDRARLYGLVYVAGLAELLSTWLDGEVPLTASELVDAAAELFLILTRRSED